MPQLLAEQRTPEWQALRVGRITASLAPDCLGLGHKSRQWAWRTILGLEPDTDNPYMKYGRENEHKALLAYEMFTGRCVEPAGFWVHPEYDWLAASPDGLVGDDGLVECKCPANLPAKVPVAHRIQILVQLLCTGRQWADYCAWVAQDGDIPEQAFVSRVHAIEGRGLIKALGRFRTEYVLTNTEPPRKKRRVKR